MRLDGWTFTILLNDLVVSWPHKKLYSLNNLQKAQIVGIRITESIFVDLKTVLLYLIQSMDLALKSFENPF